MTLNKTEKIRLYETIGRMLQVLDDNQPVTTFSSVGIDWDREVVIFTRSAEKLYYYYIGTDDFLDSDEESIISEIEKAWSCLA